MKRALDYILAGLSLLGLPLIFWWGIYQSSWSAVNLEGRLQANARLALDAAGHEWAGVRMDGQRAILSGAAPSADLARQAALNVLESSGRGGVIAGGVTLVELSTTASGPVSPYVWRAEKTPQGGLLLEGHTPSTAIRLAVLEEARRLVGGDVEDRMRLADGVPAGDFQGVVRLGLRALAELDHGTIELRDHELILRGETADQMRRASAAGQLNRILAPWKPLVLIEGDIRWRAHLSGQVVRFTGSVSSEAERRDILRAASSSFRGDIIDEMVLSPGMTGNWAEGILAGLPVFLGFDQGEMAFDAVGEGHVIVSGTARASDIYFLKKEVARTGRDVRIAAMLAPGQAVQEAAPEAGCSGAVSESLGSGAIRFEADVSAFSRSSGAALDELARRLKRCDGSKRFEIEASGLVEASELVDYLVLAGIERVRLAAISAGREATDLAVQQSAAGSGGAGQLVIRVLERSGE